MRQEEWRRLEELFHAAVARPEGERRAFLAAACGGDRRLEAELERLLDSDARAEELLAGTVEASAAAAAGRHPGQRIGPYRVERELGRGGMSAVYLARRSDGEFEQRVAIKVMRFGPAAEEMRRRLLAERQILARLHHPAIAKLFDGGTTEDGLPYFVMEAIDVAPMDDFL
jgi:serine/threonine protein kinase